MHRRGLCNKYYLQLEMAQLRALAQLSGDASLRRAADRLAGYQNDARNVARIAWYNARSPSPLGTRVAAVRLPGS